MATTEELLEEILRWQRAAVLPLVRETIERALETTQMRRAYELCDGARTGGEVGSTVGTSKQTISNWTRRWRDLGIAYDTEERRVCHLVSLDALGLPTEVGDGQSGGRGRRKAG